MAVPPSGDRSSLKIGTLGGVIAHLLGILFLTAVETLGLHPDSGLWEQDFTATEYLLLHDAVHLPVWGMTLQMELLLYTGVLVALVVLAGFAVTERVGIRAETPFRTGASVAIGYFAGTVLASIGLVVGHGAITPIQMVAPTLLVGFLYPALFGGIGGIVAARYGDRQSGT